MHDRNEKTPQTISPDVEMIWEYKMVTIVGAKYSEKDAFYDTPNALHINHLGGQGWELVTILPHAQRFKRAYFKRPIVRGRQ